MLSIIPSLLKEMAQEAQTTRKMLSIVPSDKLDWQPHPKSMTMRALSAHIAELPSWVSMAVNTDELDFATAPYEQPVVNSREDLLAMFEKSYEEGRSELEKTDEALLDKIWTLRTGDTVHSATSKAEVIRMAFCQTVHHRAQLGVYLRLLDIPIPGSYGPSADEMGL